MKTLSVVIPCFNEKDTIEEILQRVSNVAIPHWNKEIIVVDDASQDGTRDILKKYEKKFKIIFQEKNGGKGTAVKKGLEEATGDYIVIQDADLEYNPDELKRLVHGLELFQVQVVYGSRNIYHVKRQGFYLSRAGVWTITKLMNVLYRLKLTDVWTCYKLFPQEAKKYFTTGRFESEILFTAALARNGYTIAEVPISHTPRDKSHGKKIKYRDGFHAIRLIFSDRLLHLKKPKSRKVGDFSELLCCAECNGIVVKTHQGYYCEQHGYFHVDDSNRPFLIQSAVFKQNSEEHVSGVNWLKSFLKQFPKVYYGVWYTFCPVLMMVNGPRQILKHIPEGGTVVDVGSGPERIGKEFINVDIFPFPEVDVVADATRLPFKSNSIDGAVSESLIEHVPDAYRVTKEMVRILKPGGLLYISAPFIHPYHASPDDFNRWTISGLKYHFPEIEIVKTGVRSGPWSAFLMFMAYWFGILFSFGSRKTAPFLAHVFMLILGPFKYLDLLFIYIPGSEAVAAHLYVIGRKKELASSVSVMDHRAVLIPEKF